MKHEEEKNQLAQQNVELKNFVENLAEKQKVEQMKLQQSMKAFDEEPCALGNLVDLSEPSNDFYAQDTKLNKDLMKAMKPAKSVHFGKTSYSDDVDVVDSESSSDWDEDSYESSSHDEWDVVSESKSWKDEMVPPAYQEPPPYEIPSKVINGVQLPSHNKDLQDYYDELNTQLEYAPPNLYEQAVKKINKVGHALYLEKMKQQEAAEAKKEQVPVPQNVSLDRLQKLNEFREEIKKNKLEKEKEYAEFQAMKDRKINHINFCYDQEENKLGEDFTNERNFELSQAMEKFAEKENEFQMEITRILDEYNLVDEQINRMMQ